MSSVPHRISPKQRYTYADYLTWPDSPRVELIDGKVYAMAAAPVKADWATASLGTSYKINERVLVRGAASAMAFDSQTISYGGDLGVNVSF